MDRWRGEHKTMMLPPEKTASFCDQLLRGIALKDQLDAACALHDEEILRYVVERTKAPHDMVLRALFDNRYWTMLESHLCGTQTPPSSVSEFVIDILR
jgi:hypothetical protein